MGSKKVDEGILIVCKCVYCGRMTMKVSADGKTPNKIPICSRKSCKRMRGNNG